MANNHSNNPFEQVLSEIADVKHLLIDLTVGYKKLEGQNASKALSDIGGIELAEEITGKARATIYTLVAARKIPHSKKGQRLYFSRKELIAWIESGKRKTIDEYRNQADHALMVTK